MIQLEVYNNKLEALGIITNWYMLRWRKMYFDTGEFELRASATKNNIELLTEQNLITRLDDEEVGVIENITLNDVENKGSIIIVTGRFLTSILDYRITLKTYNFNDTFQNVYTRLLSDNLINPSDSTRKVENVSIMEDMDVAEKVKIQIGVGKSIKDTIYKICKVTNCSIKAFIDYNSQEIKFKLWQGRDLRDLIVLSDSDGNIQNSNFENYSSPIRNFALIAGAGEGENRKTAVINTDKTGWKLKEIFIDARDIQDVEMTDNGEVPIPEYEYKQLLLTRGEEKLKEHKRFVNFTAETTTSVNDRYKKDWDLGDIVTIYKTEWGKEIIERVTEVEETFEDGIIRIYPTFGSALPELKDILKEDY